MYHLPKTGGRFRTTHFYGVTKFLHKHSTLLSLLLLGSKHKKKIGFLFWQKVFDSVLMFDAVFLCIFMRVKLLRVEAIGGPAEQSTAGGACDDEEDDRIGKPGMSGFVEL